MFFLHRCKISAILELLYFNPFRFPNFVRARQTGSGNDDFTVNFFGDKNLGKERMKKIEAAKLCEDDQRG
jgi:hypothetical protein